MRDRVLIEGPTSQADVKVSFQDHIEGSFRRLAESVAK